MIEISGVTKRYGERTVLNRVSAEIRKGEITAFIGPNGAGKSTLLGIITRVMRADEGEVFIDGEPVLGKQEKDLAKKISILRQQNNLQVRLTVRDLVSFGRYPYSKGRLTDEDHRIIAEAMDYMGLDGLTDKYLDTLSGGERQRAFIAMVVAQDTEYIFLDEPLNNLDMKHSVEIMQMLHRLCSERDKTVVIVIHDINFASCYADRILAIRDGRICVNDRTDRVIQPGVLENIYDMPFTVQEIEGNRICVFYNPPEPPRDMAV